MQQWWRVCCFVCVCARVFPARVMEGCESCEYSQYVRARFLGDLKPLRLCVSVVFLVPGPGEWSVTQYMLK